MSLTQKYFGKAGSGDSTVRVLEFASILGLSTVAQSIGIWSLAGLPIGLPIDQPSETKGSCVGASVP